MTIYSSAVRNNLVPKDPLFYACYMSAVPLFYACYMSC
jgi:hypothetical protein